MSITTGQTVYFQAPLKNWQRSLIPNLRLEDPFEVLDTKEQYFLVKHKNYEGWLNQTYFSTSIQRDVDVYKKIAWDGDN